MADRTVHGRVVVHEDVWEIVRYDRAGKWYAEDPGGGRYCISVSTAAWMATAERGEALLGLPGGRAFDRMVRRRRGAAVW